MDRFLQQVWYEGRARWLSVLLLPLSWLFYLIVVLRRFAYRHDLFHAVKVRRPVIVVGNITVGGTGKTPLTIWLAGQARAHGVRVGIILRGYGGRSTQWPREVTPDTNWEEVGDEAVLLASRTEACVVAGPDRVAAANRAIELGADLVLCDDGLQHYRLARDREIAVVDEHRGLGNGRLLPAGPLRESRRRLDEADVKIVTRRSAALGANAPVIDAIVAVPQLIEAVALVGGERRPLQTFVGTPVHAVAGIGNPQAFFDALSSLGLTVQGHAMPDHARLTASDISFPDDAPVLMTEKDAVKCRAIADRRHWAVRMDVALSEQDARTLNIVIERLLFARVGALPKRGPAH
jgi:tetraacyldisaccharide 4'-kinase